MMFLEHDFYSNFSESLQSGDKQLTNDIIADELSELIVHDYSKVFDLLEKVGIRVNRNMSDEQLADILIDGMQSNEKLARGIAFLISERNNLVNTDTDDKSGRKYVDYVNKNLSSSFEKILQTENERKKFKTDLMKRIKSKDSKVAERRRKVEKPNYFWRNIFIAAGVIGGAYLIYHNWDRITGKTKMDAGGHVPEAHLGAGANMGATSPQVSMTPSAFDSGAASSVPPTTNAVNG